MDRPRWVASTEGAGRPLGPLSIESDGADRDAVSALETLGHEVSLIEPRTPATGWAQVIRRRPDGSYEGGADPRADSVVAGI